MQPAPIAIGIDNPLLIETDVVMRPRDPLLGLRIGDPETSHVRGLGDKQHSELDSVVSPRITAKGGQNVLKYFSLVTLTLQNATLILFMRYVRVRPGNMFMATTAVVLAEALKAVVCSIIILVQLGGSPAAWLQHMHENIIRQPLDCMKIAVPSIIYTLQNNLLYVAVSNLEAATFQVTYQLKILTTAIFSVIILRRVLSRMQWFALVVLFIGVGVVQLQPHDKKVSTKVSTDQYPLVGLAAVIVSCIMSGFAGIYFEKILKGTPQSIWLRNVQLGVIGVVSSLITMQLNDGALVRQRGYFYGYDWVVFALIVLQSIGGLLVAVVVKYADNILKGFAASTAIIISCVASIILFDFEVSVVFIIGSTFVMVSVYMYSRFAPIPTLVGPRNI